MPVGYDVEPLQLFDQGPQFEPEPSSFWKCAVEEALEENSIWCAWTMVSKTIATHDPRRMLHGLPEQQQIRGVH